MQQIVETLALERGNRNNLGESVELAVFLNHGQELRFFSNEIDLVEDQKRLGFRMLDQIECELISYIELVCHVHDDEHQITAFKGLAHFDHHFASERAIGLVYAGRVDEHDLSAIFALALGNVDHALNAIAGGSGGNVGGDDNDGGSISGGGSC